MVITSNKYPLIAEKIKELRAQLDLSQEKFSEKVNIPVTTLALIESKNRVPHTSTLIQIANSLKIDIAYFFQDYLQDNAPIFPQAIENEIIKEFDMLTETQKKFVLEHRDNALKSTLNLAKFLNTN